MATPPITLISLTLSLSHSLPAPTHPKRAQHMMMRGFSPLLLAASTGLAVLLCLVSSLSSVPQAAAAAAAAAYAPAPARLRGLLEAAADPSSGSPLILPCCYDGLTARLVARAGFDATFLTGFGASASRGYPDTQLLSYGEMLEACRAVAEGLAGAASEGSGAGAGAGAGAGPGRRAADRDLSPSLPSPASPTGTRGTATQ